MTETTTLRALLLPELQDELDKTRRVLGNIPDGHGEFKPHERSMPLARLAGHTTELAGFTTMILTTPEVDFGTMPQKPMLMQTRAQILAEFNEQADGLLTALKQSSDETLQQIWTLSYNGKTLFSGPRYAAYRSMGLNHLIHHRAQLGVYLRLVGAKVPATFGPSADEGKLG